MRKAIRSGVIAAIALVVAGAIFGALGAASSEQPAATGGLVGAGLGLATGVVAFLHLAIRTLFGRVPESRTPELAADSVERDIFRRAGEKALPDVFSILLGAALLAALLPDGPMMRWVPILAAVGSIADFAARALIEWKRLVDA